MTSRIAPFIAAGLVAGLALAVPAAAQTPGTTMGSGGWQRDGASWQQAPAAPQAGQGVVPQPGANLAPDLSDNYNRMLQQRRLNERVESGSALILNGLTPRSR